VRVVERSRPGDDYLGGVGGADVGAIHGDEAAPRQPLARAEVDHIALDLGRVDERGEDRGIRAAARVVGADAERDQLGLRRDASGPDPVVGGGDDSGDERAVVRRARERGRPARRRVDGQAGDERAAEGEVEIGSEVGVVDVDAAVENGDPRALPAGAGRPRLGGIDRVQPPLHVKEAVVVAARRRVSTSAPLSRSCASTTSGISERSPSIDDALAAKSASADVAIATPISGSASVSEPPRAETCCARPAGNESSSAAIRM
jgi:hypothetical protein